MHPGITPGTASTSPYMVIYPFGIVLCMFADACSRVSEFTRPLAISTRHENGTVRTEIATFIVLNREGWVMTAGHVYDSFVKFQGDLKKAEEIRELNQSRSSKPGSPSSQIKLDPTFITNHSFWWSWDGVRVKEAYMHRQEDIVICKLEPFDPSWIREYPVLVDPDSLHPGTSLCRSGFSFADITASWDETHKTFQIRRIPAKETIFHNDGIHTRYVSKGMAEDKHEMLYVETSTPGLKGQSGGPIFTTKGHIYAMQVATAHMPLGFSPTIEVDGRTEVANQFMNVGLGLHVKIIREILDEHGIRYDAEGDESGYRIVD